MNDTLNPKDLTAEERALVDVLFVQRRPKHCDMTAEWVYRSVMECEGTAAILARRALFGEPKEQPAMPPKKEQVVCPNCLEPGSHYHSDDMPHVPAFYTCKPATPPAPVMKQDVGSLIEAQSRYIQERRQFQEKPAPVASELPVGNAKCNRSNHCQPAVSSPGTSELPEVVRKAWAELKSASILSRRDGWFDSSVAQDKAADDLKDWALSQQAVPVVGMTPDLERLLSICDSSLAYGEVIRLVAAVRAQAASVQGVPDLPKVRSYFDSLANLPQYQNPEGRAFLAGIFAEFDAIKREAVPDLPKVRELIDFARANAQYLTDTLDDGGRKYVRQMMHDKLDAALAELDAIPKRRTVPEELHEVIDFASDTATMCSQSITWLPEHLDKMKQKVQVVRRWLAAEWGR